MPVFPGVSERRIKENSVSLCAHSNPQVKPPEEKCLAWESGDRFRSDQRVPRANEQNHVLDENTRLHQPGWRETVQQGHAAQPLASKGLCSTKWQQARVGWLAWAGRQGRRSCHLAPEGATLLPRAGSVRWGPRPSASAFSGSLSRPRAFWGFPRFPSGGGQRLRAGPGPPMHACLCVFACAQACCWHGRDSALSRPVMSPHGNGFDGIIIFWKNCRKLRPTS